MSFLKSTIVLSVLPVLSWNTTQKTNYNNLLHGVVAEKGTNKPLESVYLYTVKGEEEALTNEKGQFKFSTWQKLPVTLHVRYQENEELKIVVTDPIEKINIKL